MRHPCYLCRYHHSNNICRGVQIGKFIAMQFSQLSSLSLPPYWIQKFIAMQFSQLSSLSLPPSLLDPKIHRYAIFSVIQSLPPSLLDPKILLRTLFPNTLSLGSFLNVRDQISYPFFFFFAVALRPNAGHGSSFLRFLDHTQRRTTVGRTPLDE